MPIAGVTGLILLALFLGRAHLPSSWDEAARGESREAYDNSYCVVFRLEGGKVKEITEYFDTEFVTSAFGK